MLLKIYLLEIFLYLISIILLTCIIYFIAFFITKYNQLLIFKNNIEKNTSYECGFFPFNSTKINFDIHFYLISLFFILFDLEIVFLFPIPLLNQYLSFYSFWSIIFFLIFLLLGFFYEIKKEALTW